MGAALPPGGHPPLTGSAWDHCAAEERDERGRSPPAAQRIRAGLARLRRVPAPPPVRILQGLLGALDLGALVAPCRVEVHDQLTRPTDLDTLAASRALSCTLLSAVQANER